MFNKKYKNRIKELEDKNFILRNKAENYLLVIKRLEDQLDDIKKDDLMAALMRESLGMQIDFASASTDKCLPPHFLEGMKEDERKNFVIEMETIRNDDKFQKVVHYMINLFATNAIYKYDEEQRKNGQIAVIAFRTLLKEFEKMHTEFLSYKAQDDGFDPLNPMPEN